MKVLEGYLRNEFNRRGMLTDEDVRDLADLALKQFVESAQKDIEEFFVEHYGPRAIKSREVHKIRRIDHRDGGGLNFSGDVPAARAVLNRGDGNELDVRCVCTLYLTLILRAHSNDIERVTTDLEKKLRSKYVGLPRVDVHRKMSLHDLHSDPKKLTGSDQRKPPETRVEVGAYHTYFYEDLMDLLLNVLKPGFKFRPRSTVEDHK